MSARTYLRPTAFVDPPCDDGRALRLAGGPCRFSAVEIIAVAGGRRVRQDLVPVERIDAALDADGRAILARITAPRAPIDGVTFDTPCVMGIVNATPDSFSDGGNYNPVAQARRLIADGAAIVDIGGESTRPGARIVPDVEEAARVVPVVTALSGEGALVSVDTRKAAVMAAALDAGATMINDVSALAWDERALAVVAARGCPVVLTHHQGDPATMQADPRYGDVLIEVYDWLEARIAAAEAAGVDRARIVVDPGIGFGKTLAHNLALLNGLSLFHGLGCPILLGVSRKRMIGALSGEAPVDRRLGGTVALSVLAAAQGVQLHRVHDVFETVQALRVQQGLRDAAQAPG
ncbi:dihydropteroate synthase [Sphingomonas sp.]|uniref:dihydropteroate synthase n=1 Tax=Sphingomonas sp. TaxID=28214 RepID=UPI003B3A8DEF